MMSRHAPLTRRLGLLLGVGLLAPMALAAQSAEGTTFGVYGGAARFRAPNASGQAPPTGWGAEGGLALTSGGEGRVRFVGTLGLLTFRPDYTPVFASPRIHAAVLGAGVEVPLTQRAWQPVVGALLGPHWNFGEGQSQIELSAQAYVGVRGTLGAGWRLRAAVHGQTFSGWDTRLLGARIGVER